MGKIHLLFTLLFLFGISINVASKSIGKFKKYHQVTDKEVLIESSNGAYILVSAHEHYALKISTIQKSEAVKLISPKQIHSSGLEGSIYVEELDELMQITTVINDGITIKVSKNPLRFTFIDKNSKEVLFEEINSISFGKKSTDLVLTLSNNEEIKLIAGDKHSTVSNAIQSGNTYTGEMINQMIYPDNKICIHSSNGYSLVLDSGLSHEIDLTKPEKLKISKRNNLTGEFSYMMLYGSMQPELIEKYALNISKQDQEITLNQ